MPIAGTGKPDKYISLSVYWFPRKNNRLYIKTRNVKNPHQKQNNNQYHNYSKNLCIFVETFVDKSVFQEAQKVQEKLAEAEDELKSQYGKYGEQLEGITHEVAALGKTIVPEEKHSEFEAGMLRKNHRNMHYKKETSMSSKQLSCADKSIHVTKGAFMFTMSRR